MQSLSEANPKETRLGSRYREVRETEGSRNRDSTACCLQMFVIQVVKYRAKKEKPEIVKVQNISRLLLMKLST